MDLFLAAGPLLSPGERRCLEQLRDTPMRLYDVEHLSPGVSVTLRDVERGTRVTVHERSGSRSLRRSALLAARVIGCGASGQPEMERGVLWIPPLIRESVLAEVSALRERFRREHRAADGKDLDAELALLFHDAWISATLEPPIPQLKTTDGEDVLLTRVRFEVDDTAGLEAALDACEELEREEEGRGVWLWSGANREGKQILLGRIVLSGASLMLECHSAQRGTRGRALLEGLAGDKVRHTSTTHENVATLVREQLRAGDAGEPDAEVATGLTREEQEALTLEHLGRHYREWIDVPVPALEQHTPRDASCDPALRPKLAELIRGLEGAYEADLRRGAPAYDPSWMWDELRLERPRAAHPPPPAHERLASMLPGIGELCRSVAAQARSRPGFDDTETILTPGELAANLDAQRFQRQHAPAAQGPTAGEAAGPPGANLAEQVRCLANFELHRCKTFWVDETLAYMLAKTDVDVPGAQVRAPFPCFALVFTDRHVLSLAERMVSGDARCPVVGQILQAVTIYVSEEREASSRSLHLDIALDSLGADPPHFVAYEIPLVEDAGIEGFLDGVAPRVVSDPPMPDVHPLRGLLRVTLNAILYAASAGVEVEVRPVPARPRQGTPLPFESDNVYFLPGVIEISRVRRMSELERVPSGRGLLHRFMVRGHWRRPAPRWKDQRLRWIAPYWKGPDIAAVIERTYRLEP